MDNQERYYSLSMLRSLAYDDDVNGNCDGMIDFTVVDCISGADVEYVRHGHWIDMGEYGVARSMCSSCGKFSDIHGIEIIRHKPYCQNCGAKMDGGKSDDR